MGVLDVENNLDKLSNLSDEELVRLDLAHDVELFKSIGAAHMTAVSKHYGFVTGEALQVDKMGQPLNVGDYVLYVKSSKLAANIHIGRVWGFTKQCVKIIYDAYVLQDNIKPSCVDSLNLIKIDISFLKRIIHDNNNIQSK